MNDKLIEKEGFDGKKVKVLGPEYDKGKPDNIQLGNWRNKLKKREDMIKYLESAERYWVGEGFGSEKRKNPA